MTYQEQTNEFHQLFVAIPTSSHGIPFLRRGNSTRAPNMSQTDACTASTAAYMMVVFRIAAMELF